MAKQPFFARYLGPQVKTAVKAGADGGVTLKYPSDKDEDVYGVTLKYPSDGDDGAVKG